MALSLYASSLSRYSVPIDEDEAILPMHRLRIFSPETGYYNNSRPDDPPPEQSHRKQSHREQSPSRKQGDQIADKPVVLRLFLG